jgi:hypothetical protein
MGVENEGGNNPGYLDASTKEREYAKEEAVVDAAIANCMYGQTCKINTHQNIL